MRQITSTESPAFESPGGIGTSPTYRENPSELRADLGAEPRNLRWLVVREILPVVGAGCAAGLALAFAVGSTLFSVVYGIGAHDPAVLGASVLILIITALLAAWAPAQRAVRVDPVEALRRE